MPIFDLPLAELRGYRPDVAEPADFDAFWADTLAEARSFPGGGRATAWDGPSAAIDVADSEVGPHLGFRLEGHRVGTHLFESLEPGYRGWQWAVTATGRKLGYLALASDWRYGDGFTTPCGITEAQL